MELRKASCLSRPNYRGCHIKDWNEIIKIEKYRNNIRSTRDKRVLINENHLEFETKTLYIANYQHLLQKSYSFQTDDNSKSIMILRNV